MAIRSRSSIPTKISIGFASLGSTRPRRTNHSATLQEAAWRVSGAEGCPRRVREIRSLRSNRGQGIGEAARLLHVRQDPGRGIAQITTGMVWWDRKYAHEQSPEDQGRYEFAEQEAKAKKVGLWRDANPAPPWEFRDVQRRR